MAVRLPVIVSQTAGGSNEQQGKEAESVIQLMGMPGIDVSLIGPLGGGTLSSTDQLVLESQDRDFAILCSQAAGDTIAALRSLGLVGRRAVHSHDREGETGQGRRVFCMDWANFASSNALCQALQQILKDQQTVAIPIGLTKPEGSKGPNRTEGTEGTESTKKTEGTKKTEATGAQAAPSGAISSPPASVRVSNSDLDDLVEDLNDMNL